MERTVIIYDQMGFNRKTKKYEVIPSMKNMVENPPMEWNAERVAKYIKEWLMANGDVTNIRCNNPAVIALIQG